MPSSHSCTTPSMSCWSMMRIARSFDSISWMTFGSDSSVSFASS
ncbi:hypothetical protein ACFPRL_10005 [Pseudoclavibacter helvolus]